MNKIEKMTLYELQELIQQNYNAIVQTSIDNKLSLLQAAIIWAKEQGRIIEIIDSKKM